MNPEEIVVGLIKKSFLQKRLRPAAPIKCLAQRPGRCCAILLLLLLLPVSSSLPYATPNPITTWPQSSTFPVFFLSAFYVSFLCYRISPPSYFFFFVSFSSFFCCYSYHSSISSLLFIVI